MTKVIIAAYWPKCD